MVNDIGWSIDCDKMRTISRHFGVRLPMKMTSLVCNQFRRARTDGLPIGDGLYGSSAISSALLFDVIRPPGFRSHIYMSSSAIQPYKSRARSTCTRRRQGDFSDCARICARVVRFLLTQYESLLNHKFAQFTWETAVELICNEKQRSRENFNFKSVACQIKLARA